MSSLELAAQVSALVGTSALIFFATKPRELLDAASEIPHELRGIKRYSSYHRKRYYSTVSDMTETSGRTM